MHSCSRLRLRGGCVGLATRLTTRFSRREAGRQNLLQVCSPGVDSGGRHALLPLWLLLPGSGPRRHHTPRRRVFLPIHSVGPFISVLRLRRSCGAAQVAMAAHDPGRRQPCRRRRHAAGARHAGPGVGLAGFPRQAQASPGPLGPCVTTREAVL